MNSLPENPDRYLSRFPNYATAVDVDELTPDEAARRFFSEFVESHRPCVVRGAVDHWPATTDWSIESLRQRAGSCPVGISGPGVLYEPIVEFGIDRLLATPNRMTFGQFLDEAAEDVNTRVQLYSEHVDTLAPLADDLGPIEFLDRDALPSFFYGNRFFASQLGYTDWHLHFGDETLTAQLLGTKEILLLPPDDDTFSIMFAMARRGVWKTPARCWPNGFTKLTPYRVVLHPGDAVYIPMHWWHAAEAVGSGVNITFARVFGTPHRWLSDIRLANVRLSLFSSLLLAIAESVRSRRPRQVRQLLRLVWMTARHLPEALSANGRAPGAPTRWAPRSVGTAPVKGGVGRSWSNAERSSS